MVGGQVSLFLHDIKNDYQRLMLADAKRTAKRFGLHLEVESAERDVARQIEQIRAALAAEERRRPTLFLVSSVQDVALLPLVHDAARRGIGWVFLTRWLDAIHDFRRQYPMVPIFSVSADQREIGRLQGQQIRRLLEPDSELLFISGPLGTSSARLRSEGTREELAAANVHAESFHSDWSQEGGKATAEQWLAMFQSSQLPRVIVAAQNDAMALGARDALCSWTHEHAHHSVAATPILGCDGSPDFGQRLVEEGDLTATVIVPSVTGRAINEYIHATLDSRPTSPQVLLGVESYPQVELLRQSQPPFGSVRPAG